MVSPLEKIKKHKKHPKPFRRNQGDRFMRIREVKWRRPKGIDSRARRRMKGVTRLVKVGFGTNKKHRHVLPNGFKKFRVFRVEDVDLLLMNNRTYAAEIASSVSIRKRKEIVERALQLGVKVTNAHAKLRTEDQD